MCVASDEICRVFGSDDCALHFLRKKCEVCKVYHHLMMCTGDAKVLARLNTQHRRLRSVLCYNFCIQIDGGIKCLESKL